MWGMWAGAWLVLGWGMEGPMRAVLLGAAVRMAGRLTLRGRGGRDAALAWLGAPCMQRVGGVCWGVGWGAW